MCGHQCTISSQVGLAVALIAAASLVSAQTPNSAIKEFGLLGTWADKALGQFIEGAKEVVRKGGSSLHLQGLGKA
jgi:hypothetical protein